MFDLKQSITDWRRQMIAGGIKNPVPLDELESHLRDEIERQTESGRSESEAFNCAVQKLGSAFTVQNEFEKVGEAEEARNWKEGQILLAVSAGLLQLILIGSVFLNSEMTFAQRMSGLAAIATSILLVGVVRLSHRIFPVIRARRIRTAIIAVSGSVPAIWVWIFARYFLLGHEFPFGQWLTTFLWVSCPPLAVYLGLILGIETAARRKVATVGS